MNPWALFAVVGVAFGCGMVVDTWRHHSNELDEVKDAKARYVDAVEKSEKVAGQLQAELDRLKRTKSILTKEIHNETQRVEYRCPMPDDSRVLYERASKGDATPPGNLPDGVRLPVLPPDPRP